MGLKKKILHKSLSSVFKKGLQNSSRLKKAVAVVLVVGLLFVIGGVVLSVYIVSTVSKMITAKPDIDLIALERLISEKTIVLSKAQKARLTPIIQKLSSHEHTPKQTAALKIQIWSILEPLQQQKVNEWKAATAQKVEGLFAIPPSVVAFIEKYTGITEQQIKEKADALRVWWQLKKPDNNAEDLLNTMESN